MATLITLVIIVLLGAIAALAVRHHQFKVTVRQLRLNQFSLLERLDWHNEERNRYLDDELSVPFSLSERQMLLKAMEFEGFKDKVTNPLTKRFIRITYNAAREKLKVSIRRIN